MACSTTESSGACSIYNLKKDMIYEMIWYDMIWYDMIWYDMIWYDMICNRVLNKQWTILITNEYM